MIKGKRLAILLFIFSQHVFAYQDEIDKFFSLYESDKVAEAVDAIYSTNKWVIRKADDVQNVKTQLQNLPQLVGTYHGKVKLGNADIEDRLMYVSYLALYERQPVRFEFVFYRPENDWVIYSFSFDDQIDEELQQFAREKVVKD
ncbi:hypothetical protein [Alteromonas sp. 14N.309.X.WAT.G.H12]|uniref:hypothetical protein n=1 Tax=Alteromonas sp. 14N.309.X.WAT.G.H12 TaxID=3120824 RepID=UPI002FD37D5B